MILDGLFTTVGSYNFDCFCARNLEVWTLSLHVLEAVGRSVRSTAHPATNEKVNVVMVDPVIAASLLQRFKKDRSHCRVFLYFLFFPLPLSRL